MADVKEVIFKLMKKDKSTIDAISLKATREYFRLLKNIAEDIYDSCIAVYYVKYSPIYYDRHGNKDGFNLYNAKDILYENGSLSIGTEPMNLKRYRGKTDKREIILSSVMAGLRGGPLPLRSDWPMDWTEFCVYPNEYSKYGKHWSSEKHTMNGILIDFINTAFEKTNNDFWQIVNKYV